MHDEVIPVDAAMAQALEKRKTYPAGAHVWVRGRREEEAFLMVVVAVTLVLGPKGDFGLYYAVGVPTRSTGMPSQPRRVYPAYRIFATRDEALAAKPFVGIYNDPIDSHLGRAMAHHCATISRRAA